MPAGELDARPRFYFALPRLLAKLGGCSAARTESNWLEANIVGTATHAIAYIFFAHLLLAGLPRWQQFALLLPIAGVVWLFWLLLFALNAVVISLFRAAGLLRRMPESHVQGIAIGALTTVFAFHLITAGSWMRPLGIAWVIAVSLNLLAAIILAFTHAERPAVL